MSKKLHYRGSRFAIRDIFDLAAIGTLRASDLPIIADAVSVDVLRRSLDRVSKMKDEYPEIVRDDVNATNLGVPFLENGCDLALEALSKMVDHSASPSPAQERDPAIRLDVDRLMKDALGAEDRLSGAAKPP